MNNLQKFNTPFKVDTTNLKTKIAELEAFVAASTYTAAELAAAVEKSKELYAELDADMTAERKIDWQAEYKKVWEVVSVSQAIETLANYRATLAADLMHTPCRYVVTDTSRLVSPAGFHPHDHVFLQTKIAIHTDDPSKLPASNVPLYTHVIRGEA